MWTSVWATWSSLQVGQHGGYSIERLMALHTYYIEKASPFRSTVVRALTPLPALLTAVLLERILLQPPLEGSTANWGFWIRFWFTVFIMEFGVTTQVKILVPGMMQKFLRRLAIVSGATTLHTMLMILVGEVAVFPIPFLAALGGIPATATGFPATAIGFPVVFLVVRIHPCRMNPEVQAQVRLITQIGTSVAVLLVVYPSYNAVFISVGPVFQTLLILVLHLLKLVAKRSFASAAAHLEGCLPEFVVMLVEFFDSLYLTACLQTARSIMTLVLIVALDFGQFTWAVYCMQKRAAVLRDLVAQYRKKNPGALQIDFIGMALEVCAQSDQLSSSELRQIKLRACAGHIVSVEYSRLLDSLKKLKQFEDDSRLRTPSARQFGVLTAQRQHCSYGTERRFADASAVIRAMCCRANASTH